MNICRTDRVSYTTAYILHYICRWQFVSSIGVHVSIWPNLYWYYSQVVLSVVMYKYISENYFRISFGVFIPWETCFYLCIIMCFIPLVFLSICICLFPHLYKSLIDKYITKYLYLSNFFYLRKLVLTCDNLLLPISLSLSLYIYIYIWIRFILSVCRSVSAYSKIVINLFIDFHLFISIYPRVFFGLFLRPHMSDLIYLSVCLRSFLYTH